MKQTTAEAILLLILLPLESHADITAASIRRVVGDGQSATVNQTFSSPLVAQVLNAGLQPVAGIAVTFTVRSGSVILSAQLVISDGNGFVQTTGTAGSTAGPATVSADIGSIFTIWSLTVRPAGPLIFSVVNATNGVPSIAPGSIATIGGTSITGSAIGQVLPPSGSAPLPTTLAGVSVSFGGVPAPIFSMSNVGGVETISVQVPFDAPENAILPVRVTSDGNSATINVSISPFAPGIFENTDSLGRRYAKVARTDGTFVTPDNPIAGGEQGRLFVTGLGRTNPPALTNAYGVSQRVTAPVVVGVNDMGVRVISAVYAPNLIGEYIVTFEVPPESIGGANRNIGLAVETGGGNLIFSNGSTIAIRIPPVPVQPSSLSFVYQIGASGPPSQTLTVGSSSGATTVTATVASGGPWLLVNPVNSPTPATFTVPINPAGMVAGTYSGTIRIQTPIGGVDIPVSFTVAPSCTHSVTPNNITVPAAGLTSSFAVTAPPGCAWNATSNVPWIAIPSGASGTGSGIVAFQVAANSGLPRIGTITVGGDKLFTIFQSVGPNTVSGLHFVPLAPCRVVETRTLYNFEGRTGAFGPPALIAAGTRTLNLPASNVCNIPTTAKAYVVNVTVIPAATLNFVTIWPAGETRPNVWTIRSPDGQIVANSAIVKAGADGAVSVYASDSTDLLIDISGYYSDGLAVAGLAYYPLAPCRVIDTRIAYRTPAGPFGPPSMAARQTRSFRLPETPYCSVPVAWAYSVTITVVPPGPLAFLTAWPDGASQPNVSTINSFAGRVLANSVIIPARPDGSISVFTYDNTDFLMDINGYYAPDNGRGLFYFPVTQCRVSDSTVSGGAYSDETARTISLPNSTMCSGIPANAQAYAINVTALPSGNPMPFLTAYPTGQPRPNASILNAFQGQIVTNSALIPAGTNGAIDVYAYRRTNVVMDVSGYFGR